MERSVNGQADIDRGRTAATERGEDDRPRSQLEEIRAICLAEGIGFGTPVDSVRMLATRARLYIEMTDRVNRGRDDSQPGKPPGTMTREEFVEAVRYGIENGAPMGDPTADDDDVSQDGNPDPADLDDKGECFRLTIPLPVLREQFDFWNDPIPDGLELVQRAREIVIRRAEGR